MPSGNVTLTGITGKRDYKDVLTVSHFRPANENKAIKYLWARDKIALLDDYGFSNYDNDDIEKQVTDLGLTI